MSDPDLDFREQQGDGTAVACVAVGTIALLTIEHFLGPLVMGLSLTAIGGVLVGYLYRKKSLARSL